MRSAPLQLAGMAADWIDRHGPPDAILCTDMLDLPQWKGLLRDPAMTRVPTMIYFHENQFSYPQSPHARQDFHFGYTNLISATASDACVFNSDYHRRDFLKAAESFVARMPDAKACHDFTALREKTQVISPGFDPPNSVPGDAKIETSGERQLRIGWVSRWEHDKRPDRFVQLCQRLRSRDVPFRLVLLGNRPRRTCPSLTTLRRDFADSIEHDGFAASRQAYWRHLRSLDVVVSTADHEFFGMAICEAVWAGAVPVLPNRLSYPELIPDACLYEDSDAAADQIRRLQDAGHRGEVLRRCQSQVATRTASLSVKQLDAAIGQMIAKSA